MWKAGHSLIKAKMRETGALLGGEMSGHIFFKDRCFGFDDGIYAGARLLEILGRTGKTVRELLADLPPHGHHPGDPRRLPRRDEVRVADRVRDELRAAGSRGDRRRRRARSPSRTAGDCCGRRTRSPRW